MRLLPDPRLPLGLLVAPIGELEDGPLFLCELHASAATEPQDGPEGSSEGYGSKDLPEDAEAPATREERGAWRRLRGWFGF